MKKATIPEEQTQYFYTSPIGIIEITAQNQKIISIFFVEKSEYSNHIDSPNSEILQKCANQLEEYFTQKRTDFELDIAPKGTKFQQKVWQVLQKIPYGKTVSYLEIAQQLGDPKAVRAVGMANGKNPISIIVPCHRVIGSSGNLTGYAGGLERKRFLLDLENQKRTSQLDLF